MKFHAGRTIRFYWGEICRYKWRMLLMLLFVFFAVLSQMAWPIVLREFFDILAQDWDKDVAVAALMGMLVWLIVVEAVNWIGWRGTGIILAYLQPKMLANLSNMSFDYLHKHSHSFFSDNFSGALVKKLVVLYEVLKICRTRLFLT